MDFFIDNLYKQVALEHIQGFGWDDDKIRLRELEMWKAKTRLMFIHFLPIQVYDIVDECLAEANDEQYHEQKIIKKMFKSQKIIKSKTKGKYRKEIDKHWKITDVARKFGLIPDSKGKIECPFHADGIPSCSLNDDKNIFHCFGCNAKGDIIDFYRRLKEDGTTTSGQ